VRVAGSLFYRAEGEVAPATLRGGGPAGALVAPVSAGRPEEVDAARVRPVDGRGRATVLDRSGAAKLTVDWDAEAMQSLVAWKHQQHRVNVLGLEPSTHDDGGRAATHRAGTLVELAPGAQRRFATKITARPAEPPSEGTGT